MTLEWKLLHRNRNSKENQKDGSHEPSFQLHRKILLENDGRAGFFQFLLGFIGGILANAGEDLPTSGFSHSLGFAETQACQLTNNLDHIDLLGASFLDDHIELCLLFDR